MLAALVLLLSMQHAAAWKHSFEDPDFRYGDEEAKVAVYRLIGNDMPPLQVRQPK